ncbi:MAG: Integrase catalytic region [Candidatus Nomurabacteria bacterium GW2011_GWA2_43_66]|nr:MAG: Integrase catalytic region [Parcubacteria group bacterium GW2011_GWC1_42_21]KKS57641.1 MAG: Integrase catalytic region [Candidatus Nomurabacteria bacterium GW2011_GWF1_42_40]KKT06140.1 MAG: Integrase catalytic region [Candidatus Nomurabacteria bacterium GW2011_GWB1_43_19]KKT17287.1 MAG: Integrase catalytic region [Candidatus Nomurabacteria bacterium GW2011_GWA2_43_66]
MTIYGAILPGAIFIARSAFLAGNLSERAKQRLRILDWHNTHGKNISLTARHFGLMRETVIGWRHRLAEEGPRGLEDRSHRPHHPRRPTTSWDIAFEIVKLRKQYPAWSKYKIHSLLPDSIKTSVSTVGRILKRKNLINKKISRKRSKSAKNPRARFPRGMKISEAGDMIQMDTKYIMLVGGRKYYQFTAIDVLSKRKVMRVYKTQSSKNGALFLEECFEAFPFSIQAIQTDNGAPFQKHFDVLCKKKNIPHYYIYPRNPKQNTYVEISHGADEREFYQQGNIYEDFEVMQKKMADWEYIWNNIRPHQALDYLTPNQYLEKRQTSRLPTKDVITLQT